MCVSMFSSSHVILVPRDKNYVTLSRWQHDSIVVLCKRHESHVGLNEEYCEHHFLYCATFIALLICTKETDANALM